MAVYYATKAYVLSFSEALAEELRDTGVTVTALCPGPTATDFAATAQVTKSRLFSAFGMADPTEVAEFGVAAMMHGRRVAIPGIKNKIIAQSNRFAPRAVIAKVSRMIQESNERTPSSNN
jgi:short-subunit dehydrogenase